MRELLGLGEVVDVVAGVGFPKGMQGGQHGEIPVFKVGDISAAWLQGKISLTESRNYLSTEDARSLGRCIPAGATVFAKIGEALRLNRRVMLGRSALVDNNVMGLVPKAEKIQPKFLYYFMQTVDLGELSRSTTVPSIRKSDVVEIRIPLMPLSEQVEIVAEIEKQLSRLDEAVANLQRVKANLKRYKAAVLKAAFEGRLVETEAARARQVGRRYESGSDLLARISNVVLSGDARRGNRRETKPVHVEDLPPLPEGWVWARLDAIAALKGGITVDSKRINPNARAVPYLRVANVQRGLLDLAEVKTIKASPADIEALRLQPGDVLFNEGGDRDKLGRGWIWEGQLSDCIHQNHVFRARLYVIEMAPKLVSWWGNTFGRDYFQRVGKQTTNLASINLGKLSEFPVPIPPAAEQVRLVNEIERLLSVVHEVEVEVDNNLQRAHVLRGSVLSRAFSADSSLGASSEQEGANGQHLVSSRSEPVSVVMAAKILSSLAEESTMGRVKLQKILYMSTHHAQIEAANAAYVRMQAGPLDMSMLEGVIKRLNDLGWFRETVRNGKSAQQNAYSYAPLTKAEEHKKHLAVLTPKQISTIDQMVDRMRDWTTEQCELLATVYGAWNDLIIWNRAVTDDAIAHEVLENWHEAKRKFTTARIFQMISDMKRWGIEPSGFGLPTHGSVADRDSKSLFEI